VSTGYAYDQGWAEERARLAGMASLWDPGTQALLTELGVGGHVLEVGGGGGALVSWLAERAERVLATDIDTRFLDELASDTVEVRRHDIRTDPLPEHAFDLIHSRLVLEHLPERRDVLTALVKALKPGGTLVVEDYDWTGTEFFTADDTTDITEAVMGFMAEAGFEQNYGRRVVGDLLDAGLTEVRGEARARVIDARSPGFPFFSLSFEALKPQLVATGRLTQERADEASAQIGAADVQLLTPLMIAGIGVKPGS
jgi:SAM-dependent methyltransferase